MTNQLSLPLATRVEVIDHTGRAFTRYYDLAGASVHVQDEGRTIKVFAEERQDARPVSPVSAVQRAVAEALEKSTDLLDNPEYGGTLVDIITDHLFARFTITEA